MAKSSTPWDAVFKEVMMLLGGQAGAEVTTEYEVGRLPRKIDSVAVCDEVARVWLAEHTPLNFLSEHNLLEGKSEQDYFTPKECKLVLARSFLYTAQANLDDLSRFTVCVVSAGFPRKVLRHVPKLIRFQPVQKALWKADFDLPFYVLVCSELDVVPRNYPFLLFASGQKRREFLRALVQESGSPYLPLAFELYPRAVMEELQMSRKNTKYEEELRYVINQIGPETMMRLLSPESLRYFIERMGPETVASLLPPESLAGAIKAQPLTQQTQMIDALLDQLDLDVLEARLQARRANGFEPVSHAAG